jgi:hypothetical protein
MFSSIFVDMSTTLFCAYHAFCDTLMIVGGGSGCGIDNDQVDICPRCRVTLDDVGDELRQLPSPIVERHRDLGTSIVVRPANGSFIDRCVKLYVIY